MITASRIAERTAVVLARRHGAAAARRGRSRAGSAAARAAAAATTRRGTASSSPPRRPSQSDERRGDERAEAEADVAADREERHPARPLAPARVRGELRSLRVVGGRAEPGDDHEHDDEPVRRGVGGKRHPDARDRDAGRQQPDRAAPVRPEPEQRLDERRREPPRRASAPPRACRTDRTRREEREQRGQRAAGEVDRRVAASRARHRPPVDPLAHAGQRYPR